MAYNQVLSHNEKSCIALQYRQLKYQSQVNTTLLYLKFDRFLKLKK